MNKEELLSQTIARENNVRELEAALEKAKVDYYQSVRDMHQGGYSLREIATKLNLSHQRVHQIIETSVRGKDWRFWLHPMKKSLACSFCGSTEKEVEKLVAGPNIYMCDRCAADFAEAFRRGADSEKHQLICKTSSNLRCSFCAKLPTNQKPVVSCNRHQICAKCLEFAQGFMKNPAV